MSAADKIVARGVTVAFGGGAKQVLALDDFDMDIADGEFVCLVGPSGCGKSTLLRVIAGLLNPSQGEVSIESDEAHHLLAVVFQDYSIYAWKTVAQNVALGLELTGVPRAEVRRRVDEVLEKMRLTRFRDTLPGKLSGGMRQRVSIARALVVEPQILLMDEPFAALDAQLRMVMQEELLALWQADRRTVLFVTHNLDEAILLGDRVVVMSASPGRVKQEFVVPFERPRRPELRGTREFAEMEAEIWSVLRNEIVDPHTSLTGTGSADADQMVVVK